MELVMSYQAQPSH